MCDHCRRRGHGVSKKIRKVRRKLPGFDGQLAEIEMLPMGLSAKRMHCELRRETSDSEQQSPLPGSEVAPFPKAQPCRVQLNSEGRYGCVAITKDGVTALFLPDKSPTCASALPGVKELRPCCDRALQLKTRQGKKIESSNLSLQKTSTNGLCGGMINIHVINVKGDSHRSSALSSLDGVPFSCHNGPEHCPRCDACYNGGFPTQTNDKWREELSDLPVHFADSDRTSKKGQTILQRAQRFLPLLHAVCISFCSLLVAADLYCHWNGRSWCPESGFSSLLFSPACDYHPPV